MGQPTPPIDRPLAITGCGVLSSIGVGLDEFAVALDGGRSGRVPLAGGSFSEPLPGEHACVMHAFDPATFLGRKGTAFFDRTTSLVVVACGLALKESDLIVTDQNRNRVGITIGTSTGSVKSVSDFARDTLVQERPYLVNPVLFPNTVMNAAAGQAAIWHVLKGINATVSGGQLSSLLAMRYASMGIRQGYVDVVLAGGVEEFSPQTAWGYHHTRALEATETLVGEGCAIFVIEDAAAVRAAGRTPLAQLLACDVGTAAQPSDASGVSRALARCIHRALARGGVTGDQVWAVCGSFSGDPLFDQVEDEGIGQVLGRIPAVVPRIKPQLGECYSAAGALQIAAVLSLYRTRPGPPGRVALVTSVDRDGSVGCAVVMEGYA